MSNITLEYIKDLYLRVNYILGSPYSDPSICENLVDKLEVLEDYVDKNKKYFKDNSLEILTFCSLGISALNVKKVESSKVDFGNLLLFI